MKLERVTGWSRVSHARSKIFRPTNAEEARDALRLGDILPRGGGMSFGDAALNDGRNLIKTSSFAQIGNISLDRETGVLCCSSGLTQKEIIALCVRQGWTLPAIPGAENITIGGSIAADGHGKNHYLRGSISRHLISLEIMVASGDLMEVSREKTSDLFWATVGGLGLTGVILSAKLRLQPISSAYAKYRLIGFKNVGEMIDVIENKKSDYEYILGWADGNFRPGKLWHGAVSVGEILPSENVNISLNLPPRRAIKLPFPNPLPWGGMLAGRIVNKVIGRKFSHGRNGVEDLNQFFFPQDAVTNWNFAFGNSGFVDYQCCVPEAVGREFFTKVHQFLNKHRVFCFLVAIKRFGSPEYNGPFTFAQDGFSIAMDIPMQSGLFSLLNLLDEVVVEFGGRINPVKDMRVSPRMLRRMYPKLDEWLEVKEKYDPKEAFCSDLSRRLELTSQ
jgi:FAD/FMN-containing dehydrogenase